MNTETQNEWNIKSKFVLDNQREFLAGGVVPGYTEAMLWLKKTKASLVKPEEGLARKEAIRKEIEAERQTDAYKSEVAKFKSEAKKTKGYW